MKDTKKEDENKYVDPPKEILGELFGVRFLSRGENDPHIILQLLSEDDETWFKGSGFSSYWINDLIDVLQKAKISMSESKNTGYGWEFSNECYSSNPEESYKSTQE